ncbi:hypothetical protein G9A89_007105 [Geosiphon pyriformis]|nr:hypothetical protein G9A89_007105 [Geosiphon pyriformis]
MESSFNISVKSAKSRKKRRGNTLEDNIGNKKFAAAKVSSGHFWSLEAGNTTESNSVNMEEECLVEKTSFDHRDSGVFAKEDLEQTLKSSNILTKRTLGKPLEKINFLDNDIDNILLDKPVVFSPSLKNLVNISVRKSFTLDISLDNIVRKSAQKKLVVVRKLFSRINGFGRAFTPSKFAKIVRATFTSKLSLVQTSKKAKETKILVNSDFRKPSGHLDWAVVLKKIPIGTSTETVHAALSEFGIIKSIKMQLVRLWQKAVVEFEQVEHADLVAVYWSILIRKNAVCIARSDVNKELWDARDVYKAFLYTLLVGTNIHDIWDYVALVDGKTCGANLHWSRFVSAKCAGCRKLGHTSLFCPISGKKNVLFGVSLHKILSDLDKSRLAAIYAKHLAPVARPVSFGNVLWVQIADGSSFLSFFVWNVLLKAGSFSEIKSTLLVSLELNNRFAALECSLASLAEHVDMLAKRLETPEPTVSQLSPRRQPLVTPLSQNQGVDIVMSEGSGVATGGETVAGVVVFNPAVISKMEETLNSLSLMIMNLSAKLDNAGSDDIICWHKEKNNLVSIFTESKLKKKVHSWIVNKFDGMWVFTSGLEFGNLGAGVVIVINFSLARHMCKISEVPGQLLSIKLLFRNKLLVLILGLYAGASLTVNESSFVILEGDFNKDGSRKCASFKKCLDFDLVNALGGSSSEKLPTWSNFWGVVKTINYMLISSNLVNAVVSCGVFGVEDYFDIDHQAVSVLVGLGGLLNDRWKYNCKDASAIKWTKFKDNITANSAMFHDKFLATKMHLDLDAMWAALCKVLCLLAEAIFKRKWFKNYDHVFVRELSKFHKLELLKSLDSVNASVIKSLFLSGSLFNAIRSVLFKVKKLYCSSKISEVVRIRKSRIRLVIDKRIENFELNKGHTIRNVLEHPFYKVTLDHLVVDDELVLEPNLVRTKINVIMEEWTRKHNMVSGVLDSLEYVFDEAFSGVMCSIDFNKMSDVISILLNKKAAGLSGISNELWKHCNRSVLDMLLVLLNSCLNCILMNTYPIVLIKMACKILFKILSDRISSVCSRFDVLKRDNFSVLKGTTTQFPIFAIRSVIENALEKNCELWLVLQDMQKTYDSVGWEHLRASLVRIKMCDRFIRFFGSIHNGQANRVMIDFGLTDEYQVHDGLDQGEVFLPLFWHIFYDPLLCEVKRQESVYEYRLDSYFVTRTGCFEFRAGLTSFLAAGAFVNDTIWINDISINNDKMVAIPINCRGLSKPSLTRAQLDVRFFTNLVLRKTISNKQFLYLVLAVLHPIVTYRTQFSFVSLNVCMKWDTIICKSLKSKSGLLFDFPNDAIHHFFLYNLKSFKQVQAESKSASIVSFANSVVFSWCPHHSLLYPFCININPLDNFLAGIVWIFLGCDLSLGGLCYGIAFVKQLCNRAGSVFKWKTFKWWKRLNSWGPISHWFDVSVYFLNDFEPSSVRNLLLPEVGLPSVLESCEFKIVCSHLLEVDSDHLFLFMDGSLSGLGTLGMKAAAAVFFEDINLSLGVEVSGLVSSTMAELQAIALTLECVPSSCSINLFSNSQAALNACKSESRLICPDFRNQCWIEHCHIVNVIHQKNLDINWVKVKGHSGVLGNEQADAFAGAAVLSNMHLPHMINECFLKASGTIILHANVDWFKSSLVWHPDLHLAAGFTSAHIAGLRTYFMKALHHHFLVAVHKCLYNRGYLSVICLFCGNVEISDHVFSCPFDAASCTQLVEVYAFVWEALHAKHQAVMEKGGMILCNSSVLVLISGLLSVLLASVVRLLGIADAFGMGFGFCKSCLFFADISNVVSVHISA